MLSLGRTSGLPLCSPFDMKTAMTFFPSLDAARMVPPQPNSMSSGCAPTAKIVLDFRTKILSSKIQKSSYVLHGHFQP